MFMGKRTVVKHRIIFFIWAFLPILLVLATSCATTEDPFVVSSFISGEVSFEETDAVPGKDFYSFTAEEARDQYGLFCASPRLLLACDGESIYVEDNVAVKTATGNEIQVRTLCRSDYLNPGIFYGPVCTDPLCTHAKGSSCPFADFDSMFSTACYAGKLYFVSRSGDLYVYNSKTNRSKKLLGGFFEYEFIRCENKFYVVNREEDAVFKTTAVIYQISQDSNVTRMGQFNSHFMSSHLIYAGRYVIEPYIDSNNGSYTANILLVDIVLGNSRTVFAQPLSELDGHDRVNSSIQPLGIYGNKLLLEVKYSIFGTDGLIESSKTEIWLIDLASGEKRMLTYNDENDSMGYICLSSEKMICTLDQRADESDHLVIRLLEPDTDKETIYDLSEMAAAVGETISIDAKMFALNRFAVLLKTTYKIPYTFTNAEGVVVESFKKKTFDTLLFDLASGRVYKYPEPTEEDLTLDSAK